MKVDKKIHNAIDDKLFHSPIDFYRYYMRTKNIDRIIFQPFADIRDVDVLLISRQVKEEVLKEW